MQKYKGREITVTARSENTTTFYYSDDDSDNLVTVPSAKVQSKKENTVIFRSKTPWERLEKYPDEYEPFFVALMQKGFYIDINLDLPGLDYFLEKYKEVTGEEPHLKIFTRKEGELGCSLSVHFPKEIAHLVPIAHTLSSDPVRADTTRYVSSNKVVCELFFRGARQGTNKPNRLGRTDNEGRATM